MLLFVPVLWYVRINRISRLKWKNYNKYNIYLRAHQQFWGQHHSCKLFDTAKHVYVFNLWKVRKLWKNECNFFANSWWSIYEPSHPRCSERFTLPECVLHLITVSPKVMSQYSPFHLWTLFAWLSWFLRGGGVSWLCRLVCVLIWGGSGGGGAWWRWGGAGL